MRAYAVLLPASRASQKVRSGERRRSPYCTVHRHHASNVTIGTEMGCGGGTSGVNHFALVSYIPGRLAAFLDDLRAELKPGCMLRAHVTVLPPRPLQLDVDESIHALAVESRDCRPFHVELGDIAIFDKSIVVYLSLSRGVHELHALHENLISGQLEYDGPF